MSDSLSAVLNATPSLYHTTCQYPVRGPFHPPGHFPEFGGGGPVDPSNTLYAEVRAFFESMGLDYAHRGTARWNPLGQWIQPGMRVVVKPNWVKHEFGGLEGAGVLCTHPGLLRPLIDYALLALRGDGRLTVCDAPLQGADFGRIRAQQQIERLEQHYARRGAPVEFLDLRERWAEVDDATSYIRRTHRLPGDPRGYVEIDLGSQSRLHGLAPSRGGFAVTDYTSRITTGNHRDGHHRYRISRTVLESDVLLNVPKLKTHAKTGITCALKNLVGINGSKDYLPHFRPGSPDRGGDEYPRGSLLGMVAGRLRPMLQEHAPFWVWKSVRRLAVAPGSRPVPQGGAWQGNDTLWRTIHDLAHIAAWFDGSGNRRPAARPLLSLADAMVAGEGDGPLRPKPRSLGVLLWSGDPGNLDIVAASLMGFPWRSIPMLARLRDPEARPFSRLIDCSTTFASLGEAPFEPPPGWDLVPGPRQIAAGGQA